MPIYEYKCDDCENIFEVLAISSTDTERVQCNKCNSEKVSKLLSAGSFRLSSGTASASAAPPSCGNSGFS